ncbi:MAG: hypothetical protein AAGI66_04995 [Cyanobacteria bacterium P01_H01_bin.74]
MMPSKSITETQQLSDETYTVLSNLTCGTGLYLLHLKSCTQTRLQFLPGQFVMLDLPETQFAFRRPFSILDCPKPDEIRIYYKAVGFGTKKMVAFQPGEMIRCLGPLGNTFPAMQSNHPASEKALYVAGGIGIAPMIFQASFYKDTTGLCIYGVRSHSEIGLDALLASNFKDRLYITTDDGSAGTTGNVCTVLEKSPDIIDGITVVYVCGPTPMMKAVCKQIAAFNPNLPVYVSLEEHMPCGTGACSGCVVQLNTDPLPVKTCQFGPIFLASTINWQGIAPTSMPEKPNACNPHETVISND